MAEAAVQQLAAQAVQLAGELAQARDQLTRQASALDQLREQARTAVEGVRAEVAASELRTQALVAAANGRGGAAGDNRFDLLDFKTNAPSAYHGRRDESWKQWSRKFRTTATRVRTDSVQHSSGQKSVW